MPFVYSASRTTVPPSKLLDIRTFFVYIIIMHENLTGVYHGVPQVFLAIKLMISISQSSGMWNT